MRDVIKTVAICRQIKVMYYHCKVGAPFILHMILTRCYYAHSNKNEYRLYNKNLIQIFINFAFIVFARPSRRDLMVLE